MVKVQVKKKQQLIFPQVWNIIYDIYIMFLIKHIQRISKKAWQGACGFLKPACYFAACISIRQSSLLWPSSGWGWWRGVCCSCIREQLQRGGHLYQPPADQRIWVWPSSERSQLQREHGGLRGLAGLHNSWDAPSAPEHPAGRTHRRLHDAGTWLPPHGEKPRPGLPTSQPSAHCWEVLGKMQCTSTCYL